MMFYIMILAELGNLNQILSRYFVKMSFNLIKTHKSALFDFAEKSIISESLLFEFHIQTDFPF